MDIVTISRTWRITIPPNMRNALDINPGQQFQVIAYKNHIELVPLIPPLKARGFLRGIDTTIERDE